MQTPLSYYGTEEHLTTPHCLAAGEWTAQYANGALRYVQWQGVEIVRMLYAAVRDQNWGTVPAEITEEHIEQQHDGFVVTFRCVHRQGNVAYHWRGRIEGSPNRLTFDFDGVAQSDFLRNRIGFCLLHPIEETRGLPVTLQRKDGEEESCFPTLIAGENPFLHLTGMRYRPRPDRQVTFSFEGDEFETEDQRNWIDQSFKTFCTPLSRPFPVLVKAGDAVNQKISIDLHGAPSAGWQSGEPQPLYLKRDSLGSLPTIGLCAADLGRPLTATETSSLQALNADYVRAECRCSDPDWLQNLATAVAQAEAIGVSIEVELHTSGLFSADFAQIQSALTAQQLNSITRWHLFRQGAWTTDESLIAEAKPVIQKFCPTAKVVSGSAANFTELNRATADLSQLDGVCFSVTPQEHASDHLTLIENIQGFASTIESAVVLASPKPVHVSPAVIKKRVNPYAMAPDPPLAVGRLPQKVDYRQMALFGAVWTAGMVAQAARMPVASLTLADTVGWLGIMEREEGCALPEQFRSLPAQKFPVYFLLQELLRWKDASVLATASPQPLLYECLHLQRPGQELLFVFNYTPYRQTIHLQKPSAFRRQRTLDQTNWKEGFSQLAPSQQNSSMDLPPLATLLLES
jgi:D-apionolactonase